MSGDTLSNTEQVRAILRRNGTQMKAYEILDEFRKGKAKAAPQTVYRALSSLVDSGEVHRLESLNSFVLCSGEDHHESPSILSICDDCGQVEERTEPFIVERLSSVVGQSGFEPKRHVLEVHGICATCNAPGAAP